MNRAWNAAGWLILLALIADLAGLLGPRNCPVCGQRRSFGERINGIHACDPAKREAV